MVPCVVPPNSFSSLAINGLVKKDGSDVSLLCPKISTIPAELMYSRWNDELRPEGFYIRPPSKLPPAGNLTLQVSVKDELGYGRIGSVYNVDKLGTSHFLELPDLVIKVAHRYGSYNLAREAWFYEELEDLQGVAIARYYGVFQVVLDESYEVLGWNPIDEQAAAKADIEIRSWGIMELNSKEAARIEGTLSLQMSPDFNRVPYEGPRDVSYDRRHRLLTVMVLEKLGERVGPEDKDNLPMIVPELADLFSHLNDKGIMHEDIDSRNILCAPDSADNLICPTHGHVHKWRIIDFDLTRKTIFSKEYLTAISDVEVKLMCDELNPPVKSHEDLVNVHEDDDWGDNGWNRGVNRHVGWGV